MKLHSGSAQGGTAASQWLRNDEAQLLALAMLGLASQDPDRRSNHFQHP
ncbi:MAG: hypothetical protein WAN70_17795 [Terriglobales bacterium]